MQNRAEIADEVALEYALGGFGLGWRLLACPWANLASARVALITLNPGGAVYEPPAVSVEAGSAYVIENWLG